jgi:putative transposase
LVDTETYYKTLVRYVLQNPVRANMVHSIEDYPWC